MRKAEKGAIIEAKRCWRGAFANIFAPCSWDKGAAGKGAKKKGVTLTGEALDTHAYKEQQYDKLADSVRKSLDMDWVYRIMEGKV